MDGQTVRVQHGFSFWSFSGGITGGPTTQRVRFDSAAFSLGQRANGFEQPSGAVSGGAVILGQWLALALLIEVRGRPKPYNWHCDEHYGSIKVETRSHYGQECIVMGKCRGFALSAPGFGLARL